MPSSERCGNALKIENWPLPIANWQECNTRADSICNGQFSICNVLGHKLNDLVPAVSPVISQRHPAGQELLSEHDLVGIRHHSRVEHLRPGAAPLVHEPA